MFKARYIELVSKQVIITTIISGIVFFAMLFFFIQDTTIPVLENVLFTSLFVMFLCFLLLSSFITFVCTTTVLIIGIYFDYKAKKDFKRVRNNLSNKFSSVLLKNQH